MCLVKLVAILSVVLAFNTQAAEPNFSYDATLIDSSADPCDDFYQYACGTWLKNTETPKDRPVRSRGFSEVEERKQKTLKSIAERYSRGEQHPENPDFKKIGDIYSACQDEAQIEKSGRAILKMKLRRFLKCTPCSSFRKSSPLFT